MNTVDFGPAAQRLADMVVRVGDDELAGPTPLPAYTLGDLIDHVGGLALAFTAAANKDVGSPYVGPPPEILVVWVGKRLLGQPFRAHSARGATATWVSQRPRQEQQLRIRPFSPVVPRVSV